MTIQYVYYTDAIRVGKYGVIEIYKKREWKKYGHLNNSKGIHEITIKGISNKVNLIKEFCRNYKSDRYLMNIYERNYLISNSI